MFYQHIKPTNFLKLEEVGHVTSRSRHQAAGDRDTTSVATESPRFSSPVKTQWIHTIERSRISRSMALGCFRSLEPLGYQLSIVTGSPQSRSSDTSALGKVTIAVSRFCDGPSVRS